MKLFDLTGKRALITGATHGLGMSMARGLGQAGAQLIINGHSHDRLTLAVEKYKGEKLVATGYEFDVTNEDSVLNAVEQIEREQGPIDILINNAGIIKRVPAIDMKVSDFREVIEVDLIGPFIVSKAVAKNMLRRRRGKIINVCSMMSELGRNSVTAYAAAKGGLKMLTKNLATEWASYNIQVNGIGPGYFATDQTLPLRSTGHPFNDFILNRTPAGRWGDPQDLAGTIIFLSSHASDFVTGQIIYVDGGILATIGKPMNEVI